MRNWGISGGKISRRRRRKVCRLGRRRRKFFLGRSLGKRNIGIGTRKGGVGVGVVWVKNGGTGRRRREVSRLGRWRWKFFLGRSLRKRNINIGTRKVGVGLGLALVGGMGVGVVRVWVKNGSTGRTRWNVCRLGRRWRWKFFLGRSLRKRRNICFGTRKVSVVVDLAFVRGVGVGVVRTRNGVTGGRNVSLWRKKWGICRRRKVSFGRGRSRAPLFRGWRECESSHKAGKNECRDEFQFHFCVFSVIFDTGDYFNEVGMCRDLYTFKGPIRHSLIPRKTETAVDMSVPQDMCPPLLSLVKIQQRLLNETQFGEVTSPS